MFWAWRPMVASHFGMLRSGPQVNIFCAPICFEKRGDLSAAEFSLFVVAGLIVYKKGRCLKELYGYQA